MADHSSIEWTDSTWNPVRGCTRVSPGCGGPGPHGGCYAEGMAARFSKEGQWGHGFAEMKGGVPRWTGKVELVEKMLTLPLTWKQPRKIFVNSTSDLFHEKIPDEAIDRVFAVMALCPQHVFQILTKRPERMQAYLNNPSFGISIGGELMNAARGSIGPEIFCIDLAHKLSVERKPLPNIWMGTSVEDQPRADERREPMRALAAMGWLTWVSYEPALGPVDWAGWEFIKWMVSGGESGPRARATYPDWHRSTRDWCGPRGIPYLFKQWGMWAPYDRGRTDGSILATPNSLDEPIQRFGKKRAGRLLDGKTHDEFPR